jgi:hypothetical protein
MGLKHELTKLRMMWTDFMGQKKGAPWRFLMETSPFTAVEFRLCNIPKLTYSLINYSY